MKRTKIDEENSSNQIIFIKYKEENIKALIVMKEKKKINSRLL